ncbi:MAG TPA: hypothetical protein VGG13_04170 [Candidatus Saccharimonadales bacterium]|jgi:hypothetical protein
MEKEVRWRAIEKAAWEVGRAAAALAVSYAMLHATPQSAEQPPAPPAASATPFGTGHSKSNEPVTTPLNVGDIEAKYFSQTPPTVVDHNHNSVSNTNLVIQGDTTGCAG